MLNFRSILLIFLEINVALSLRNLTSFPVKNVDFDVSKCPQVLNCNCVDESTLNIECHGVDESIIAQLTNIYGSGIRHLKFYTWQAENLNFDVFANFSQLESLVFLGGEIEIVNATVSHPSVRILQIHNAEVSSDSEVCHVITHLPNLENLNLSQNYLKKFDCDKGNKLKILDLSGNQISHIDISDSIRQLNVSNNQLTSFENISMDLTHFDISFNLLTSWPSSESSVTFPNLISLSAAKLNFRTGFQLNAPLLETLNIDGSALRFIDFYQIQTPNLKKFSARDLLMMPMLNENMHQIITRLTAQCAELCEQLAT